MRRHIAFMLTIAMVTACSGGDAAPPAADKPAVEHTETVAATQAASDDTKRMNTEPYTGRFAKDPLLTADEVALIPADQLRLVRNEIYARHGRGFKSEDLQKHFDAKPWYATDPAYFDGRLTENDKKNAALLQSFEGTTKLATLGEFTNEHGVTVMFTDDKSLVEQNGGGMYEFLDETRHYASRGQWIITWTGAAAWNPEDPEVKQPQVWKLDLKQKTVTEQIDIPRG